MSVSSIILIVMAVILSLSVLALLIISAVLCIMLSYPKRFTKEFTHRCDVEKGLIDIEIENYERKPYIITMSDGYLIHADFIPYHNSKKFVIIAHGYTWDKEGSLKYAKVFHSLGYNCIIYDERSHGDNKHKAVTMGAKESRDLHEIIQHSYRRYGSDIHIGLHGESLGAATVLLSARYNDKIDFIISDCAYADLTELLKYKLSLMHLPHFLLKICAVYLFVFQHYRLNKIKPAEAAKNIKCPVLIIHGAMDDFIPPEHAEKIFQNITSKKNIILFDNANHSESIIKDPVRYKNAVSSFLADI